VLAATSICFDLSVFEIFVPLAVGGAVILAENALELPRLPAGGEVTLVNTVPSAMAELVRQWAMPTSVRTVNLRRAAARRPGPAHPRPGDGQPPAQPLRPVEDTTYSTIAEVGVEGEPTIGRPLPNTRAYVVDARLYPLPVGVPASSCWPAGARPRLSRPSGADGGAVRPRSLRSQRGPPLPHRRFGPLDAGGGARVPGASRHQVKVRGFRHRAGEIEAVLQAHPAVRESVVVARRAGPGAEARDLRLVAYVVLRDRRLSPPSRRAASAAVPASSARYMVPRGVRFAALR